MPTLSGDGPLRRCGANVDGTASRESLAVVTATYHAPVSDSAWLSGGLGHLTWAGRASASCCIFIGSRDTGKAKTKSYRKEQIVYRYIVRFPSSKPDSDPTRFGHERVQTRSSRSDIEDPISGAV